MRAIFGDRLFDNHLLPHFNPGEIWQAVDNASLLMAYGGRFKAEFGWDDISTEPSKILENKMLAIAKYRASRTKGGKKEVRK
jgi:hypothetical protein